MDFDDVMEIMGRICFGILMVIGTTFMVLLIPWIIYQACTYEYKEPIPPKPRIHITYTTMPNGEVIKTEIVKPPKEQKVKSNNSAMPLLTTMMMMNSMNNLNRSRCR